MMTIRLFSLLLVLLFGVADLAQAGTNTLHNAATADATGKNISVVDAGMVGLTVTISGTATVTPQGSADGGGTWTAFSCVPVAGGAAVSSMTASGQYLCSVSGLSHVQAPLSGCSACTVTVKANTSLAGGGGDGGGVLSGLLAIFTDVWDTVNHALKVTLATLISGEDQLNNLLMIGTGVTRQTTLGPVTAAATDSAITTVPNGRKTFQAYIGGASETKAFDISIYGNWQNSTTGKRFVCRIWQPSTASVTHLEGDCTTSVDYPYWMFSTDSGGAGYTSASGANLYVYAHN